MKITALTQPDTLKGALDLLYPGKKTDYHADFAKIMIFLSSPDSFARHYFEISEDLCKQYTFYKSAQFQNSLMLGFYDVGIAVGCPFREGPNIVLVGSAWKVFAAVVGGGYLFKDGTGPSHGEYAHSIQWLAIANAVYYEDLRLEHSVLDLYKATVGPGTTTSKKLFFVDANSTEDALMEGLVPYWQLMVDCARELRDQTEDVTKNAFANSFRSPSFLTAQMFEGDLADSWLAQHVKARYESEKREFKRGVGGRSVMRDYHTKKQVLKRSGVSLQDGVNVTVPPLLLQSDTDLNRELVRRGFDFDVMTVKSTAAFDGVAVVWGGSL